MGFLDRLFGNRQSAFPLGLADAAHPARRWIDVACVIADQRLEVKTVEGRSAIETNSGALRDFIGAVDMALAEAPTDPDLLTARGAAKNLLHAKEEANEDFNHALRADPNHIEAAALRTYGERWNNLLFLPSWSTDSRYIHPVLAEKANHGDALHCVRHKLQVALVLLLVVKREEYVDAPARYCWEVVCSETPFGPIGVHYSLLEVNGKVRRQECMLTPPTQSAERSEPPPSLLARLPSAKTCFIVLAESSGKVIHNLQYNLPPALRAALSKLSRRLSDAAGTDSSAIRQAADWHMRNFDMDALRFPD